jgi:hypothetical protein
LWVVPWTDTYQRQSFSLRKSRERRLVEAYEYIRVVGVLEVFLIRMKFAVIRTMLTATGLL